MTEENDLSNPKVRNPHVVVSNSGTRARQLLIFSRFCTSKKRECKVAKRISLSTL